MSTVYLHVGQCGVQIGKEYWKDAICNAQVDKHIKYALFFLGAPRCLFIDAERKVIQRFIDETKKSKILKNLNVAQNSIRCRKGCGSNWAMGYNQLGAHVMGDDVPNLNAGFGKFLVDRDSTMLEVCIEAVRTKVEACDSFSGFLCLSSLAGGTGSGWGTRLCVELRDTYPTAYRLWNVVVPHADGESPTQNYNQLLSLSRLQECADAVVLLQNDHILNLTELHYRSNGYSIADMNKLISNILQALYMPISCLTSRVGGISIGIEPWEMLRSVAPMPSKKFLQTGFYQLSGQEIASATIWDKLLNRATSSTSNYRITSDRCLAALCVCRGLEKSNTPDIGRVSSKLKTLLRFVEWNPFPVDVWLDQPSKTAEVRGNSKSLSLCLNCSSSGRYLQKIHDKAQAMFRSGAYVHWYAKHGVTDECFSQAFDVVANVVKEYQQV